MISFSWSNSKSTFSVSGLKKGSWVESKSPDDTFDFCYSVIVFQHIPDKKIVENYIKEVSRILKSNCLFRFQIRGTVSTKPREITTWDGVQFTSNEIHKLADENNFKIIEENSDKEEYYWLTFKSIKSPN